MNVLGLNSPAIFAISVIILIILGPKRVEKGWLLFQRLLKFLLGNEEDISKDKLNLGSQLDLKSKVIEVKEEVKSEVPEVIEVKEEIKLEVPEVIEVKEEVKSEAPEVIEVKEEVKLEAPEVIEVKEEVKSEAPEVIEVKEEVKVNLKGKKLKSKKTPNVNK